MTAQDANRMANYELIRKNQGVDAAEAYLRNERSKSGKTTVIYGSDDIANYQYNMIENPGPLAEMPNQPAKNFYGGRYNMEVLQEDRIMYRAGNAQNPYGRWFKHTVYNVDKSQVIGLIHEAWVKKDKEQFKVMEMLFIILIWEK